MRTINKTSALIVSVFLFIFGTFNVQAQHIHIETSDSVKVCIEDLRTLNLFVNLYESKSNELQETQSQLTNCKQQVNLYNEMQQKYEEELNIMNKQIKMNDALVQNMKKHHRMENIYMGVTIGGLTISVGTLLYLLFTK